MFTIKHESTSRNRFPLQVPTDPRFNIIILTSEADLPSSYPVSAPSCSMFMLQLGNAQYLRRRSVRESCL